MSSKYVDMSGSLLHNEAVKVSKELRNSETNLIELLGIINDRKIYVSYRCTSIYTYAEKYLELKYQKAHDFLMLYNASKKIPELKEEIKKAEIGYTKLRTVLPALEKKKEENKNSDIKKLIEKTKTTSRKNLEIIVRDIVPLPEELSKSPVYMGKGKIKRVVVLTNEQEVILDKAMNLLSREAGENLTFEKFLELASRKIINHKLRAGNKKALVVVEKDTASTKSLGDLKVNKEKLITTPGGGVEKHENNTKNISRSIPAKVKKEVITRDGLKCKICKKPSNNIQFHHVKPFSKTKNHEPNNIISLCHSCHSLIHQGYLKINMNEKNELLIQYLDQEVLTFTDYLFKQKREQYLKEKYSRKTPITPPQNTQNLMLQF